MRTAAAILGAIAATAVTFFVLFVSLASGHVYGPIAISIEAIVALLAGVGVYRTIAAKPYRSKWEDQAK